MAIGDSTMLNPFLTQSFNANGQLPPNYQEARDAFQRQLDAQNAQGLGSPRAAVIGNDQFGQPFGYASDANAFNQFYNQNYGTPAVGIASPGGAGGVGTTTYLDNFGNRIQNPNIPNSPFLGIPGSFPGGLSGMRNNQREYNLANPNTRNDIDYKDYVDVYDSTTGTYIRQNPQFPPGYRPIELPRIREDYTNPINFLPSEPITPGTVDEKASKIDAGIRPFLTEGLRQAQEIFLRQQPQMFPGQTFVSPSEQTLQSIQAQEDIARQASPILGQAQQAYQSSLGQVGQTAAGGFLNANPYQQAMIDAATRPLTQQFSQSVLPGISSLYSKSGRLGSGAMERALGTATESYGRSLGDITANIAGSQYQQERGLQQQAQLQQAALAQAAPQMYGQQFLPSQTLGQIGAQREAIAAQPLQEQMSRFAYQQRLPYEQLSGYLSSVYGSPLGQFGTPAAQPTYQNRTAGALGGGIAGGLGGYALGSMLPSSFLGGYGGLIGGGLGALGGGLLGGGFF